MSKHVVALVAEIPAGTRKLVEIEDRSIGIFNIAGEFYALRNRCPHEGGSLCEGTVTGLRQSERPGEYEYSRAGEIVRCPWHGWEFDIKTGQSWFDPDRVRVRPYEVTVETEVAGYQPGPFKAETYAVTVEAAYVVVDLARSHTGQSTST